MRRLPLVLLYVMLIMVTVGSTSISLALMENPASFGAGIPDGRTPLTTVEQRQAYYDQLLGLSPEVLWRHWQEVDLAGDNVRSRLVIFALATRIRMGSGEEVYQQVRALLQRRDIGLGQRIRLAQMMSEVATPEAAAVLVEVARSAAEPSFEVAVRNALVTMSDNRWQGRFHTELSPLLETAWLESDSDDQLTHALALALAKVGAESGVDLLLRAVAETGQSVKTISSGSGGRAAAALAATSSIRNPEALAVLTRYFRSHKAMDAAFVASGEALASMGHPEATTVLLKWVESAPDEAAELASRWAGRARDQDSIQLWHDTISQRGAHFGSAQVHKQVKETLQKLSPREE